MADRKDVPTLIFEESIALKGDRGAEERAKVKAKRAPVEARRGPGRPRSTEAE